MALSDEQIDKLMNVRKPYSSAKAIERAVTREVRKDDEALIRQMLEALEQADYNHDGVTAAIAAASARLAPPTA